MEEEFWLSCPFIGGDHYLSPENHFRQRTFSTSALNPDNPSLDSLCRPQQNDASGYASNLHSILFGESGITSHPDRPIAPAF